MKLNLYNVKNIKDDESIGRCDFKDILLDGLILEDIRNENYPNLKANEQFLYLQKTLSKMENQLQAARRIYNIDVTKYNTYVYSFPSSIVASLFHFKEAELFEADASANENPKVS